MVILRARRGKIARPGPVSSDAKTGGLDTYFAQIGTLLSGPDDSFYVTAQAIGQPHFVQVSVNKIVGLWVFQFDIPITDWSALYADKIEAEARSRGLTPVRVEGGPMDFLDVDFASQDTHDAFTRWVVTEVFGLPDGTRYEITWGSH